jgi:hypothetical protein
MDAAEATRQAEAHLKNAEELAPRPVGKEELLYMWDNQITALDNFLADTESIPDASLKDLRGKIRATKKKLTDAVLAFEVAQAGEEMPTEPTSDEEWAATYLEMAGDMSELVAAALAEPVTDVKDLPNWEEPLAVVNGFLADSEPFQDANKDLRRARSQVRVARRQLKTAIEQVFANWRKADMAGGRDDEDDV